MWISCRQSWCRFSKNDLASGCFLACYHAGCWWKVGYNDKVVVDVRLTTWFFAFLTESANSFDRGVAGVECRPQTRLKLFCSFYKEVAVGQALAGTHPSCSGTVWYSEGSTRPSHLWKLTLLHIYCRGGHNDVLLTWVATPFWPVVWNNRIDIHFLL